MDDADSLIVLVYSLFGFCCCGVEFVGFVVILFCVGIVWIFGFASFGCLIWELLFNV